MCKSFGFIILVLFANKFVRREIPTRKKKHSLEVIQLCEKRIKILCLLGTNRIDMTKITKATFYNVKDDKYTNKARILNIIFKQELLRSSWS